MARIDEEFGNPFVRVIEEQQTPCGMSIAASAADFLIIGLHGIGNVRMDDEAYLAAIDSHAEGIRGDDDAFGRIHESILNRFPFSKRQTRVICRSRDACAT